MNKLSVLFLSILTAASVVVGQIFVGGSQLTTHIVEVSEVYAAQSGTADVARASEVLTGPQSNEVTAATAHLSNTNNPHLVTAEQIGALPQTGTAEVARVSETLRGGTPLSVVSGPEITIDAALMSGALITATNDITVLPPSNPTDGKRLSWRFYASGGDRTVTWPTETFRIPNSSTMTNSVVVSNGTFSVFVTEFAAPTTNWLIQAYIWGY